MGTWCGACRPPDRVNKEKRLTQSDVGEEGVVAAEIEGRTKGGSGAIGGGGRARAELEM
jgi:hypothetical protein